MLSVSSTSVSSISVSEVVSSLSFESPEQAPKKNNPKDKILIFLISASANYIFSLRLTYFQSLRYEKTS